MRKQTVRRTESGWQEFAQQQQQENGVQAGQRPRVGQRADNGAPRYTNADMVVLGNSFDTNSIIEAIQRWIPPAHWFMDQFFPFDRISDSDLITLDYYKQGRLVGGHIHPAKRGLARPRKPYFTSTYSPPPIKLVRDLDAQSLAKRRIGRNAFEGSPDDGAILAEDTTELLNEIINAHELMCAQLMMTGQLIIEDWDDRTVIDTITLPGVPNSVVVADADKWDRPNSPSPFLLIKALQRMISGSMGDSADIICMGSAAADAFEEHPEVKAAYNLLFFRQGMLRATETENTAVYSLGDYRGVPIYVNEQSYLDRDGNTKPFFPPDTLLVASRKQFGLMAFAACYQTEPETNSVEAIAAKYAPQYWLDHGADCRRFRLQSRGLPCLHDAESFVVAKVV
jgi:hypothetical protein